MTKLPVLAIISAAALLPWQAMAADTPTPPAAPKPPTMGTPGNMPSGMGANMPGPPDYWDYWNKMDTDHDGKIDKNEWLAHAQEQFKEFDTTGKGYITKEDIETHREKMRAHFEEMRQHRMGMMPGGQGGMMPPPPGMMSPPPGASAPGMPPAPATTQDKK